mmetsp:Transcript_6448/g.18909  ORF Transcript_6448/g.18909 Transcript_6448/m.18909 type:complete len:166 (-) Transcript_6448:965-1462(-)
MEGTMGAAAADGPAPPTNVTVSNAEDWVVPESDSLFRVGSGSGCGKLTPAVTEALVGSADLAPRDPGMSLPPIPSEAKGSLETGAGAPRLETPIPLAPPRDGLIPESWASDDAVGPGKPGAETSPNGPPACGGAEDVGAVANGMDVIAAEASALDTGEGFCLRAS